MEPDASGRIRTTLAVCVTNIAILPKRSVGR
jgi:hypothetical protein